MIMSLPALYTAEETAAKLKVTRRAVYRWLSTGKLKGLRIGQHWRIAEEELMEFMKYGSSSHHRPATPKGPDAN
jgi:excisionase family DNA binding protein